MALTLAQLQALKADIALDGTLSSLPHNSDNAQVVADAYNATVVPTFYVYRTNVPVQEIFNQITWANMTPSDVIPTDTDLNVKIWEARAIECQSKQFNLQTMLMGVSFLDASKANIRAGLQDALTNVPAGASGALVSGGWVNVRDNALARAARRVEKLFATGGNGAAANTAATLVVEGTITYTDVINAWNT